LERATDRRAPAVGETKALRRRIGGAIARRSNEVRLQGLALTIAVFVAVVVGIVASKSWIWIPFAH
jgi:hypothetical protein